ncbi:MAG: dihydrodipicolinate synthase family protein [Candidatus Dormiibacterota bacterium]
MTTVRLPRADRSLLRYDVRSQHRFPERAAPARSRRALAAAHVVVDPLADVAPDARPVIDWEATLRFRHHLWGLGLGVAEAMDTAQRGMGLDWETSRELIRRTGAEARRTGGDLVCGAQTDHLSPGSARGLDEIVDAYQGQCAAVEEAGGQVVLMASRELCRIARSADDYLDVYHRVLGGLRRPALVHWLGEMFDPALAGYWGAEDLDVATETLARLLEAEAPRVDGIKISVLEQRREVELRRRLPAGMRMYTGDDYHYPAMIGGDGEHHSDALLGAFDVIAPAAAASLAALDAGDGATFQAVLAPTLPLARHVFGTPTYYYKTGIVFLAYLNGHQSHFRMVRGLESGRSVVHLAEAFRLADQADLLRDPELATERLGHVLALAGID